MSYDHNPLEDNRQARIHSREPSHYVEDLEAAMCSAGLDAQAPAAQRLLTDLGQHGYTKLALSEIRDLYGDKVYGAVLLFSIEARTSLAGDAEVLTFRESLDADGLTIADLGWPADILHDADRHLGVAQTPTQQARVKHLRDGIAVWRAQHIETPSRSFGPTEG